MTLPRRAWPWLVLAGLAACVLGLRGCVSVAQAQTVEQIRETMTATEGAVGGGMAGAMMSLAVLLLVLWKTGLLPALAADPPPKNDRRSHDRDAADNEGSSAGVFLTRREVEALMTATAASVRDRADEQHERVRATLRETERRLLVHEGRIHDLHVEIVGKMSHISATLEALAREGKR